MKKNILIFIITFFSLVINGETLSQTIDIDSTWCTHKGAQIYPGDFNGDGRTDLMCKDASQIWINYADKKGHIGKNSGWETTSKWCTHKGAQIYPGDFDGDRRTDLMCKDKTQIWISYANRKGQVGKNNGWETTSKWCTHKGAQIYPGDFNGDRRTDLMCKDTTQIWISYANKKGHVGKNNGWETASKWCTHKGGQIYPGDFNVDGRTDLMCKDGSQIWISYADKKGQVGKKSVLQKPDLSNFIDWRKNLDRQNILDAIMVAKIEEAIASGNLKVVPSKEPLNPITFPEKPLDPIAFKGNTYNVQFLTPGWWPTNTISSNHWPNTTERAEEIAEYAIGCLDFSLLQETVNTQRREEILNKLNEVCKNKVPKNSEPYTLVTLRHNWGILDTILKGPGALLAIVESISDELGFATRKDVAAALQARNIHEKVSKNIEVVKATPISHEEISVMTNRVISEVNQLEFSLASGHDRLMAKGALHVNLHLTTRPGRPEFREPPIPFIDPRLDCFNSGNGILTGGRDCPPPIQPESPDEPEEPAGGIDIDLFVTHLNADKAPHTSQIRELLNFVDVHWSRNLPMLMAGDFNIALTDPNFNTLCKGLQALVVYDGEDPPSSACDNLGVHPTNAKDIFYARVGATNEGGWDKLLKAPSKEPGRQIDQVFVLGGIEKPPSFSRDFNRVRGAGSRLPVGLIADGFQTLSDHAEIEISGGEIKPNKYSKRPSVSVDRIIEVEIIAVHAGISDCIFCSDPDPMGIATLKVGGVERKWEFGPSDDRATLTVRESFSVPAKAGVLTGQLIIDLEEYDKAGSGKNDELDIHPSPSEENATIDLDFSWIGGISMDREGLGYFGQPTRLDAGPNWISFKITVLPQ